MFNYWWKLPGPSRFVDEIVDDIRDGKNVILLLPEHFPEKLENNVRLEFEDDYHWRSVQLDQSQILDPLDFCYDLYISDHDNRTPKNIQNLFESDSFAGQIFWLSCVELDYWEKWKKFITMYQHACRTVSRAKRTIFCICLSGALSNHKPEQDVCLSVRKWNGYIDELDLLVYSSKLLESFHGSPIQKKLSVHVVGAVTSFDPYLADRLSSEPLGRILEPEPVLMEMAKERGWENFSNDSCACWENGSKQDVEGEQHIHSAFLSLFDSNQDLKKRIWSAQVKVLFPYTEEQRRRLLYDYGTLLNIPHVTPQERVITELYDLELSHIHAQFRTGIGVDAREIERTDKLRRIRNALSHLDLVDPSLIPY